MFNLKALETFRKAEVAYLKANGWIEAPYKDNISKWQAPQFIDPESGAKYRYFNGMFPGDICFQAIAIQTQRMFDMEHSEKYNKYALES